MRFQISTRRNRILYIAGVVLACIVVAFVLFRMSILPSVALEQELRCDMKEHAHVDSCYDGDFLSCKETEHLHDGNCYIVLLKDNDVNAVLTLIDENEENSLEYAIEDEETVQYLTLNDNLNRASALMPEANANDDKTESNIQKSESAVTLSVGDSPVTGNYNANFYIYLDKKWTCIGTLPFKTQQSGYWNYSGVINTSEVLDLVNDALDTEYTYNSFDISVASSLNGSYSTSNASVGSVTTTLGTARQESSARAVKYVRLIPNGGSSSSTAFAFYTVKFTYPEGGTTTRYVRAGTSITLPAGNYEWKTGNTTYAAGDVVTITNTTTFEATLLGPITFVNIHYDIDFPTVSGVTVSTQPTIAGLTSETVTDGFSEGAVATVRNVSQQTVEGKVNNNSTGLSRVIQFRGWRIGNTDVVLQPNTSLVWEELVQYATGTNINLTAVWDYAAVQSATFFIRFDSVAVDTDGNITGQDQNKYTNELFSAYIGGIDTSLSASQLHSLYHIADTTADNSFGADQEIRALYGERTDGIWLSSFPSDDQVFADLVQYAKTGYLSVDGKAVKAEDLNSREYAIRWYVFKCQDDAWHIDGKLVKKEGLIHIYKTFAGNKDLIAEAKTDFYIDAYNESRDTHHRLDLQNYESYDKTKNQYMWEITDVDYGELWHVEEHPHIFSNSSVEFNVYAEYSVMDAHGDQSVNNSGTNLTVNGMTYALDEGKDRHILYPDRYNMF